MVEEDGSLSWSTVYLFPHFVKAGAHAFLRVSTSANASVRHAPASCEDLKQSDVIFVNVCY